nr:hypothetical protein BaRGS_008426 [Batillaria attramentaria]
MTCITHFYQQGAQSYLDLAGRLQFLFIAQEHMQAYLDPQRWVCCGGAFTEHSADTVWYQEQRKDLVKMECKLKPVAVLKKAVSEQLKMKRSKDMLQLLDMVDQRRILDDDEWDEVARDETEALIKMIRKEHNKINALIMSGKLRSAYLTAAKTNRAHDITRIMAAAERMGQAAVRNICKKWLEQQQKRDADNGHT